MTGETEKETTLRSFIAVLTFLVVLFPLLHPLFAAHHEICGEPPPAFEEELLNQINRYRQKNGLKPLSLHAASRTLAKSHSQYMCETERLTHDNFGERFRRSGRMCCVENVGWNYSTAAAQFEGWKESKGHNENMLDKKIRVAGVSKVGAYVTFFACE
ncbi:MAG TPA: CAP domain-containing protein [Thermodesulfovibrionales bacterium]|nr:CAP domain-containing protein [Thermodesulfovibrionales bacterium]